MKKRMIALLLTVMMVTAFLAGCGGSSKVTADMAAPREEMSYESAVEAPAAGGLYGSGADAAAAEVQTNQKLIKRVSMEAETEELESLLPQVTGKVAELGGYIETQKLNNGSAYSSYRNRNVSMTIRIPADRLGEFVSQVEGLAHVVNYSESTEDVTLKYVDTESRVKALEVEQERLLALLEKAENLKDLLEIEDRLTDVRYELESYASQLRALDNKIDYATVNLNITQVKVYTEVEPQTVWQRISGGFGENLTEIGEDLTDFFVWIAVYSPQLLFWAAVITGVATVLKRKLKKVKVTKVKRTDLEEKPE